jgi:hypothetical protein
VGKAKACPPFIDNGARDGGHGARAPLPTLRGYESFHGGRPATMILYNG